MASSQRGGRTARRATTWWALRISVLLAAGGWLAYQAVGSGVRAGVREISEPHIHGLAVDPFEPDVVGKTLHTLVSGGRVLAP